MKILLIIPGINKKYNDNAHSYIYIRRQGVEICAIASRFLETKGVDYDISYECTDSIQIHRIYDNYKEQTSFPIKKYDQIRRIVNDFKPDVIFCSERKNMHIAVKIKKDFNIPIVLLVEFANNYKDPSKFLEFIKNKKIPLWAGRLIAHFYWRWLCRHSSAIITCYHGDRRNMKKLSKYNTPVYYVPWPTHIEKSVQKKKEIQSRGIFIGALSKHKNIVEFRFVIPALLDNTPIKEFYIIGTGEYQHIIDDLKERYPDRIIYFPSVGREDALQLIADSLFAYVPMKYGGWGFIGDCWAMKTPIIATNNDYELVHNSDCLIATKNNVVDSVNLLLMHNDLYQKIQEGGYHRFLEHHDSETVGERYLEIVRKVLYRDR